MAAVKQVLLVLILAGVLWSLYRVGRELLFAGAAILAAFARLLSVLVQTLPHVALAGVIALGGVWLVNHLDNSSLRMPSWMQASGEAGPPPDHPAPASVPADK
jgi:thiol:disulfide interchange protein